MPRTLTEDTLMISDSEERGELISQRLGEKLRQIREAYKLTQGKMLLIVNPTERDETNRARLAV